MGLEYAELPWNPYSNAKYDQANGNYINYLQMEQLIVVPVFGIKEDDEAVQLLEEVFAGHAIVTIDSNDIANDGGVLNCISWNIRV